jgi:hypothetical protein
VPDNFPTMLRHEVREDAVNDFHLSVTSGLQGTQKLAIIMLCVLAAFTAIGCVDGFMARRAGLPQAYSVALLFKVRASIMPRLTGVTNPVVQWLRDSSRRLVSLSAKRPEQRP